LISVIKTVVREIDLIGRYGGDEFLIILPDTKLKKASIIANRILKSVVSENYIINDLNIKVSISVGISEYIIDETIDNFIERVDKALYDAKNSGRNCIKIR
jgi:diguanylate cyclase (GGDEF)-like protein